MVRKRKTQTNTIIKERGDITNDTQKDKGS